MKEYNDIAKDLAEIMKGGEPENENRLQKWAESGEAAQETLQNLTNEHYLSQKISSLAQQNKQNDAKKLVAELNRRTKMKRLKNGSYSIAAALIAISFLLFYTKHERITPKEAIVAIGKMNDTILNPTIILASGEKIVSEEIDYQFVVEKRVENPSTKTQQQEVTMSRFVVPNKFTSKIILADGTIVHMNAASELLYPTEFQGKERIVELKGEAYFEVTKSDVPFVVVASEMRIKVYGTKFNVKNYDTSTISALLVEGSVGASYKDNNEVMLQPNDLIKVDRNSSEISVEVVDPESYIAWLGGYIKCDRTNLSTLIEDIARWWNVEFTYSAEDFEAITVTGAFDRTLPLEDILQTIEATLNVKFIKEKGVYVIENKN